MAANLQLCVRVCVCVCGPARQPVFPLSLSLSYASTISKPPKWITSPTILHDAGIGTHRPVSVWVPVLSFFGWGLDTSWHGLLCIHWILLWGLLLPTYGGEGSIMCKVCVHVVWFCPLETGLERETSRRFDWICLLLVYTEAESWMVHTGSWHLQVFVGPPSILTSTSK